MNCKTCGYSLWNLKTRTCPECGDPFRPSDFDFALNSVQYQCPGCEQSYYGTGVNGHLVPRRFACVTCGIDVDMDDMILLPTEGVQEEQTRTDRVAWADPDEKRHRGLGGIIRAAFSTTMMAMARPKALGDHLPRDASHIKALALALPLNVVYWFIGLGVFFALGFAIPMFRNTTSTQAVVNALVGLVGTVAFIVFGMVLIPMWLWAVCTHAIVRIGGRTGASVKDTANAIAYASTANIITSIPCVGHYLGWIWWVVSAVFTVQGVHKIGGGRASVAVLVPVVLSFVLVIGGFFGLIFLGASQANNAAGAPVTVTVSEMARSTAIATTLRSLHDRDGAWPDHGLRLVPEGALQPTYFVSGNTATNQFNVSFQGTNLRSLSVLSTPAANALVDSLPALPDDVIAHRVGDTVLTYHGVPVLGPGDPRADAAGELWIAVTSVDPDLNGVGPAVAFANELPRAMLANGTTRALPRVGASDPNVLAEQNALRAEFGLAPLPVLETITQRSPAVASGAPSTQAPDTQVPESETESDLGGDNGAGDTP